MTSGKPTLALGLAALLFALVPLGPASATSTPPPTPVPPKGSPSPFPTVLHTPSTPGLRKPPRVQARAALLADLDTGQILFGLHPDLKRPIASITKIMTAILTLERTQPGDVVTVRADAASPKNTFGLSELGLQVGERQIVLNLMYALMLGSANDAAEALADHISGSQAAFVRLMNARAAQLGARHTRFFSPSGLDDRGYSTPRDLLTLTREAYAHPLMRRITATEFHDVPSPRDKPRHIQNRNVLLWLYPGAFGVKTGFTTAAGHSVVAAATRGDEHLVAVVLGERNEAFSDAATLLDYGFAAFEHRILVRKDEPLPPLMAHGERIPIVAAGTLESLIPAAAVDNLDRLARLDPSAPFPPRAGDAVGTLTVSTPGMSIGRVPLIASRMPEPPPPPEGPWWRRVLSSVGQAAASALDAAVG